MRVWDSIKPIFSRYEVITDIENIQEIPSKQLIEYLEQPMETGLGNRIVLELIKRLYKEKA